MQPDIPARPDVDTDGNSIEDRAVPGQPRRWRTRVLAIVSILAVLAAGLSLLRDEPTTSCAGGGSDAEAPEIGVRWIAGERYCFRVSSSVSGILSSQGFRAHHVAQAVERITLLIRSVGADGQVTATMEVVDESLTVDGQNAATRAPLELAVSFDPTGAVHSQFGWGVPTGISNGNGLPSPGQFLPLLKPRVVSAGDRWSETLSIPLRGQGAITGTFEGSFVGPASVDGRDALELEASYAMAASVNQLSVGEQGVESGLPAGAVYVFDSHATTIEENILLDAGSHELLRATLTSDGASEFRIGGLPKGDPRGEPNGFDGELSLTIERIF